MVVNVMKGVKKKYDTGIIPEVLKDSNIKLLTFFQSFDKQALK